MSDVVINGACVGAAFALVALGFVVINKATGVINFAQGGMVMLGAYFTYNITVTWGLPFYVSLVLSMVAGAVVGMVIEAAVLRHLIGEPVFAQIMVTIGLLFIIQEIVTTVWGPNSLSYNDPWGIRTVHLLGATVPVGYLWRLGLAAVTLPIFFAFFRFSTLGVAMRATALDAEAAMAQGISARRVYLVSWAIAGAVAALAGTLFSYGPGGLTPVVQITALLAFPAIILGGLDSPGGAVVGGLIIGISQNLAAKYAKDWFPWIGDGFAPVAPYVVMVLVLLIRPYGLFGTKEVQRV